MGRKTAIFFSIFEHRVSAVSLTLCSWCLLIYGTLAQEHSGEDQALVFYEECLSLIADHSLEPVPAQEVVKKSVELLLDNLGEQYADARPPLFGRSRKEAVFVFGKTLNDLASRPGQRLNKMALAELAISLYLGSVDDYSTYRTPEELLRFKEALENPQSGIGMQVLEEGGKLLCFPFPDSSAEAAGIPLGSELIMVDGISLEDKSIFDLAGMIRGEPGSKVSLRIEQNFGRSKVYEVMREQLASPTVLVEEQIGNRILVKLRKINAQAVDELRKVAEKVKGTSTLILDLRSCPGGAMNSVVEIADFFLPENIALGAALIGNENLKFETKKPRLIESRNLVILHNEGTASAAEFLIGALMCNRNQIRVSLQGETTYGKGVAQERHPLSNGGLLEITTSRLYMPDGRSWDGQGLDQDFFDSPPP